MLRTFVMGLTASIATLAAIDAGPDVDPEPEEIERLVMQLGSDEFSEREDASHRLRDLQELVLPALRPRLNDPDAELRLRARALLEAIERNGEIRACRGHKGEVLAVALLPGDKQAVSAGAEGVIRLWDLETGVEVRRFKGHKDQVWALAVSPDGKQLASGGRDLTVRVWDVATATPLKSFPLSDPVRALAYTPGGESLLVGNFGKRTLLFDLQTAKVIQTFGEQLGGVLSVAVSADGKRALTGGSFQDRTVRLWDIEAGRELKTMAGHDERISAVAFLPGDRAVSAAQDKIIRIWDLTTAKELFRLTGHTGAIHSLALSPDGLRLLTGAARSDSAVRVWDLATRQELRRYHGHQDAVCALAITANGKHFVSVSSDQSLRLWPMPRVRRPKGST